MLRRNLWLCLVCLLLAAWVSEVHAEHGKGRGRHKNRKSAEQGGASTGTASAGEKSNSRDDERGPLSKIPKQWYEGTIELATEKAAAEAEPLLWLKDVQGAMYLVAGGQAVERLRKEAVGQHVFAWGRSWTNERGEKCLKISQFEKAVGSLPTASPKHHRRGQDKDEPPAATTSPAPEAAPATPGTTAR